MPGPPVLARVSFRRSGRIVAVQPELTWQPLERAQEPRGTTHRGSCLLGTGALASNALALTYGTMSGSAFLITSVRRCRTGVNPL